jgi:hypothetical protein
MSICDGFGAYCFETAMNRGHNNTDCAECIPDCEQIDFTPSDNKYRMNYERECNLNFRPQESGPLGPYDGYTDNLSEQKELDFQFLTAEKYK